MAINQSELESFRRFIGEQIENRGSTMTAEEALQSFRADQRRVDRLREHLKKSNGDQGRSLDDDALKERLRKRLAEHGITD